MGGAGSDTSELAPRTEDRELVDRAHAYERAIDAECRAVRTAGIRIGELLYQAFEERAWELVGYEEGLAGKKAWLAEPPRKLSYSHACNLAKVYGDVVVKRGIAPERLDGVDLRELQMALPAIADGKGSIEDAIEDAKELGRRDFEEKWKGDPDAALEPPKTQCPTCGEWVDPEQLEEAT